MALGKYFEDNMEIFLERQRNMEERRKHPTSLIRISSPQGFISDVSISFSSASNESNKTTPTIQKKKRSDIISVCKDCGELYIIYEGEQKFFKQHHLHFPKRCRCCRSKRKTA
jgi:hypothetical protein